MTMKAPVVLSRCADCGVGTFTLGEYYMVRDDVWEQAWVGRRAAWQKDFEMLCIGCLEARIGRTLTSEDFIHCQINNPALPDISDRFRNRLTTTRITHAELSADDMTPAAPPKEQDDMNIDNDAEGQLIEKILDVVDDVENEHDVDVVNALLNVFVYVMTGQCSNCRKDTVKLIKRSLPKMLADANEVAAELSVAEATDAEETDDKVTCH
jgi:hypothetical protein